MIQIQVFAKLTNYYDKEFSLSLPTIFPQTQKSAWFVEDVFLALQKIKPEAKEILTECRAALNEEFCSREQEVKEGDCLFIFPPFSGG